MQDWSDDKIYHTAREINIYNFRKIALCEYVAGYLPQSDNLCDYFMEILRNIKHKSARNVGNNPITTVIYRFHSMVPSQFKLVNISGYVEKTYDITESTFNSQFFENNTIEKILLGASLTPANRAGLNVIDSLRNIKYGSKALVSPEVIQGMDLVTMDIMRGR